MKTCSKCKIEKPIAEFSQKGNGKTQSWCKLCHDKWFKAFYEKNKKRLIKQVLERQERRFLEIEPFLLEIKSKPCMDCEESFEILEVMELDHVRGKKTMGISQMIRSGYSIETIKKEIKKCDVVCANCHRIRTYKRRTAQGSSNRQENGL